MILDELPGLYELKCVRVNMYTGTIILDLVQIGRFCYKSLSHIDLFLCFR
jgi:hypothetical protein